MDTSFMYAPIDVIEHHGVKGQHWGIRRYTDANGHLNVNGKAHYLKYIQTYAGTDPNFGNRIAKYRAKGMSKEQAVLKAGKRSSINRKLLTAATAAATVHQLGYGIDSGQHAHTVLGALGVGTMILNHKYYKAYKLSAKDAHKYSKSIR